MPISQPRRQQLQRLRRAAARGAEAAAALVGAIVLARADAALPALAATVLGAVLLADGAHTLRLAGRSRVGAVSEARVRAALEPLRAEGWAVRQGVSWPGGGDIDHVVRSPTGTGFAIETKTRRTRSRSWSAQRGPRAGSLAGVVTRAGSCRCFVWRPPRRWRPLRTKRLWCRSIA
jgi:Nuclease-related domain